MERYFFNIQNENNQTDSNGFEFEYEQEAVGEAIRYVGELVQHDPVLLTKTGSFYLMLTDANDMDILKIEIAVHHKQLKRS